MKKNFKNIFLFLFFILFCESSNAVPRCEQFYQDVYNDDLLMDVFQDYTEKQKTIGIRLLNIGNKDNSSWVLGTSPEGYFKVGKITSRYLSGLIKIGDEIISVNGKDLREFAKKKSNYKIIQNDLSDMFEENEQIIFKIRRKNSKTNSEDIFIIDKDIDGDLIVNKEKSFTDYALDFWVNSIKINQKENSFIATIETDFYAKLDNRYDLVKHFSDNAITKKEYENNRLVNYFFEVCYFNEERWHKLNTVDPGAGWIFDSIIKEEKQLREAYYYLRPSDYNFDWDLTDLDKGEWAYKLDKTDLNFRSKSVYHIKSNFNLQNFPFDKQKIEILLRQDEHDVAHYRALVTDWTLDKASKFKQENKIEGWNIVNVDMNYFLTNDNLKDRTFDGFKLSYEIDRKSNYYIYKIIIPIFLILVVCWSSVWINPRELESRLTITIVCLLSLIAYNFVIDKDLPKLEYFTIMDYLILVSYVYAAIPTFVSVITFQSIKMRNKNLLKKINFAEDRVKKFGLLSYFLIMIVIILYNVNSFPQFTNSLASWMIIK
tara:strand:- start:143 stop:1771 length:1629 start_codon:yes stop_codon:yes gene_type:complete